MDRLNKSMVSNSPIEWTGPTWNWIQGCVKKTIEINGKIELRKECEHCYMYREKKRYGQKPQVVVRSKPATFNKPLKLQKEVEAGLRTSFQDRLVFTCSWSDWNNPEADEWRPEAWDIVRRCKDLIFQILTKLPQRMLDHLPPYWDEIKDRCWVGVSAGYQEAADEMIPYLLEIPATTRFLSCEPLLGPIDLSKWLKAKMVAGDPKPYLKGTILPEGHSQVYHPAKLKPVPIHWVIGGGESDTGRQDTKARPTHPQWARLLRDQCQAAGIPYFFKQWGDWLPDSQIQPEEFQSIRNARIKLVRALGSDGQSKNGECSSSFPFPHLDCMYLVGKKAAGAKLDGQEWKQFPEEKSFEYQG